MVHFILEFFASLVVVFYFLCNYTMTAVPEMMILFKNTICIFNLDFFRLLHSPYLGGGEEGSAEWNGTG